MSRRILAFAVLFTLVLSAAACNSPLDPGTGSAAAAQGAGLPAASGDSLPQVTSGSDDPATHDVGDDNGVDDPTTHDVGDDRGVDDPATHDVNDDNGGNRGDNGSGRGGADDPANHQ